MNDTILTEVLPDATQRVLHDAVLQQFRCLCGSLLAKYAVDGTLILSVKCDRCKRVNVVKI